MPTSRWVIHLWVIQLAGLFGVRRRPGWAGLGVACGVLELLQRYQGRACCYRFGASWPVLLAAAGRHALRPAAAKQALQGVFCCQWLSTCLTSAPIPLLQFTKPGTAVNSEEERMLILAADSPQQAKQAVELLLDGLASVVGAALRGGGCSFGAHACCWSVMRGQAAECQDLCALWLMASSLGDMAQLCTADRHGGGPLRGLRAFIPRLQQRLPVCPPSLPGCALGCCRTAA